GGPCAQITAACREAGFVQGAARGGNGLQVDCVAPIMQGTAQERRGSRPLPQIDPQIVAACKTRNPNFAQRGAARQVGEPPAGAPPPLATAPAAPAAGSSTKRPNIVFILTDDLSWNLVQYMPHVLQMQKDGVTFTNYFVTDSL